MINNDLTVNWDDLQHRINACRNMSDAGKKQEAVKMLKDLAREIVGEAK